MRIFVTGTAGFIGFHLARRLLEAGHQVDGYDGMTTYYGLELKQARPISKRTGPLYCQGPRGTTVLAVSGPKSS